MGSSYGFVKNYDMEQNIEEVSILEKTKMDIPPRSDGDGMETDANPETATRIPCTFQKIQSPPFQKAPGNAKRKEPKFVPYEPYKAAVSPIITPSQNSLSDKAIIDASLIKPLASQVIKESAMTFSTAKSSTLMQDDMSIFNQAATATSWIQEKVILENKVKKLEEENKQLEAHFKIQTQVNADLKKLLVASLGEDMQAKVQYMTEDKAKLGEHVLLYSQKLSENNEELEKASVESNLWRSKFEATSVLIDELSSWKVVLTSKFNESTEAIESLLNENSEIYLQLFQVFRILHSVQEAFDPSAKRDSPCANSPWNLLQLTGAIRTMSGDIRNRLLGPLVVNSLVEMGDQVQSLTPGEQLAYKLLDSLETLPALTKLEVCQKQGLRIGSKACSLLPHSCTREPTVNCCRHCSGKVRLI